MENHNRTTSVLFGLVGLSISVAILSASALSMPPFDEVGFAKWMTAAVVAGLLMRGLRRKAFFGPRASVHTAFSLDWVLQGAILLYPQLPYPSIEAQFLSRNTGVPTPALRSWFRVRATAAISIPLMLAGITCGLAGQQLLAIALLSASLVWILYRATCVPGSDGFDWHFAGVMMVGLAAALVEGLLFTRASLIAYPQSPQWCAFLLYALLLTFFELSPLPLALGALELAWILASSLQPGVPGILMPIAYRFWRSAPVLLLTWFYLPRYKMKIADLYNPNLAAALAPESDKPRPLDGHLAGRPLLSVILPAYNEEKRLPEYLPKVQAFCRDLHAPTEILVVDDGSTDATAVYVRSLAAHDPSIRLIQQPFNQGKGAAVRRGVVDARGDYILFADADGATPIAEATKLLAAGQQGADVVIGSRKAADQSTQRDRSFLRGVIGSVFYRITNLLAVPGILDTQCGFKLFRRTAAQRIFPQLRERGWAFDVEILFLAQKYGMTITEVPVNWSAVEGSKLKTTDGIRFFFALFRIRHRAAGLTTPSNPG